MKKNIQINLFGTLYNIDDDAYELLERYLDSMRSYFSRQEGGEEVADDIEHRVAELLWQRKQQGMQAVSIETVREIIKQIGNPQEIDDGDAEYVEVNEASGNTAEENVQRDDTEEEESGRDSDENLINKMCRNMRQRRLFRNSHDKILGGVCSGLADYVGVGDVVLWRLLFVFTPFVLSPLSVYYKLSVLGFWTLPILYLVLWLVVPEAHTPEDRLRMRGRRVTPESINEEIINDSRAAAYTPQRSAGSGCLKVMLVILAMICLFPLFGVLVALLIGLIVVVMATVWNVDHSMSIVNSLGLDGSYFSNNGWFIASGLFAGLLIVVIPIYLVVKKLWSGSIGRRSFVSLFIIWILMLVWSLVVWISGGTDFQRYINRSNFPQGVVRHTTYTVDSVFNDPAHGTSSHDEELVDSVAIDLRSE